MSVDPRKRQKQLQRRSTKRKGKQELVSMAKHASIGERLAAASRYPVLDCWLTSSLWINGMGWVCLSREQPNGFVAFAVFLLDRYCLGVKDVIIDVTSRFHYDGKFHRTHRSLGTKEAIRPAKARKLVEEAVAYAHTLGLPPHADYPSAARLFGDIDPAECTETFEFGKDGKPFFIAGPHDTPERCRRILAAVERACGPEGFHYTMPMTGAYEVLPESMNRKSVRVIGADGSGAVREFTMDLAPGQTDEDARERMPGQ
jgi:hypothetical protein